MVENTIPNLEQPEQLRNSHRVWIASALLAALLHLLWLYLPANFYRVPSISPRIEIQEMSPEMLERIREKWRQEKPVLVDPKGPTAEEAPDNARFSADRNIRVEREQRAKNPVTLPSGKRASKPREAAPTRPIPKIAPPPQLGELGVKIAPPPSRPAQAAGIQRRDGEVGDQAVGADDLPVGSENMLNAQESIYYSFYVRIFDAIAPVWRSYVSDVLRSRAVPAGDYITRAEVLFDDKGNIVKIQILVPASIHDFDEAVIYSWKKAAPFANPPSELLDARGLFKIVYGFRVQVDPGAGINLLPPQQIQ